MSSPSQIKYLVEQALSKCATKSSYYRKLRENYLRFNRETKEYFLSQFKDCRNVSDVIIELGNK